MLFLNDFLDFITFLWIYLILSEPKWRNSGFYKINTFYVVVTVKFQRKWTINSTHDKLRKFIEKCLPFVFLFGGQGMYSAETYLNELDDFFLTCKREIK